MRRSIFLPLAMGVLLCACDGEDTIVPVDRVVALGTYGYQAEWLHPASQEWERLDGDLVLDIVTPDSVHGRWVIAGFVADSTGGYWNENAYVLPALREDGLVTVRHRLWRIGSPSELRCSLTYSEADPTDPTAPPLTTSGTCAVVRSGS